MLYRGRDQAGMLAQITPPSTQGFPAVVLERTQSVRCSQAVEHHVDQRAGIGPRRVNREG